ncbi:MAG: twin-arginine translocase subunit TatC [Chloroflexi bacterium]|nr:twin-arginine translocase subunit TatC [Chloroflexota bacterium]
MPDQEMSLIGHLAELRRRLMICAVALIAGLVVAFVFRRQIIDILREAGDNPDLYFTTITGGTETVLRVVLYGGLVAAIPVFVYQAIRFLAPALGPGQRKYLYITPGVLGLAFAAGAAFAYFIVVPPSIRFLLNFGEDAGFTSLPTADSYINLVVALMFWMGVSFELPFVMYFLSLLGITTPKSYTGFRRPWIVIAVVLGAVITPTFDPINQALVAGPFIVLYEVGILLSRFAWRGKPLPAA